MLADDKGLLAMDESVATCNQRFASAGIPQTLEMRRAYRELLLTTPGLSESVNGIILHDETIRQSLPDGTPFVELAHEGSLLVGIKVDTGAKGLAGHPGEKVTEGLDGLRDRLQGYFEMGARFCKWRGVITVDEARLPTRSCIQANAHALARYAALCQEAGMVPIVEPEVLMEGAHTLERCQTVTEAVLRSVFEQLVLQGVMLEATILKPNMVVAGLTCPIQSSASEVASATLQCLRRAVPAAVPGIAFLSGGQTAELASCRLNAIHGRARADARLDTALGKALANPTAPWTLSFSFARAIQHPALDIWNGEEMNRTAAQQSLLHRARCNRAALRGEYSPEMESR